MLNTDFGIVLSFEELLRILLPRVIHRGSQLMPLDQTPSASLSIPVSELFLGSELSYSHIEGWSVAVETAQCCFGVGLDLDMIRCSWVAIVNGSAVPLTPGSKPAKPSFVSSPYTAAETAALEVLQTNFPILNFEG